MGVRSFTVSELVRRVRRETGMLGDDNPNDPEIVEALSDEYCALYAILVSKKRGYFQAKQTITTSGDPDDMPALPADYTGTLSLHQDPGASQQLRRVTEIQFQDLDRYARTGPFAEGFLIVGPGDEDSPGILELFPCLPAGQVYLHRYIPAAKKLTLIDPAPDGETNVVEGFMGWEERLVLGAVKRLQRSEGDTAAMQATTEDIKKVDEDVANQAEIRNAMQATTIADVESYDCGYGYYGRRRLPRP